jgi:hypothetical protein
MTEMDQQAPASGNMRLVAVGIPAVCILVVLVVVTFRIISGSRMPLDSPVPMMYRTEAQMQSLLSSIDKHHKMYGEYPPSGIDGQKAAVDALNATVQYLTELPRDAWGRHFVYIRSADYDNEAGAIKNLETGGFHNPETYQLYSLGMDGQPSITDSINNWDKNRSWRKVYEDRQKQSRTND